VKVLSHPEFLGRISDTRTGWHISAGEWVADYPSPGQFLELFLACSNYRPEDPSRTTNAGGFCDAGFDRLVARAHALQITDPAKAERIWARADRIAVDQAAWAPLVSTASVELLSRRTGHFTVDATSQPAIDQLWVR
jgi:ABC-type oligopeptide transport system substrate-binding subunit